MRAAANTTRAIAGAAETGALRWIVGVAGRSVGEAGVLLAVQVVLGASVVLNAAFLRDMVDNAVAADQDGLVRAAVSFALLIAAQIALRAVSRYLNERIRSTMENKLKGRLFRSLVCGDYATVKATHSGEWMNRLTSDTSVVADSFTQIVPGLGGMVAKLVAAIGMLTTIEPLFGCVIVVCGAFIVVVTGYFRRILKHLHKNIQEADGRTRVLMQERLESLLAIRAFARERATLEQAGLLMEGHKAARMRRNRFSNVCNVLYGVVMRGAYVAAAIWCAWGIYSGAMSYGTFIAVLQLVSQIHAPLSDVSGYLPRYYAMLASAERLREAELGAAPAFELEEQEPLDLGTFKAFGLDDVSFTYDEGAGPEGAARMAVEGLSLSIARGDYVAFTGYSGCGKSTALKLLMGVYVPTEGSGWYEDADGRHALASYARWLFAYVPQGNMLMSGTIRDVLAFGDKRVVRDDGRLYEALRIACADTFVRELDEGLDTPLGEHGAGLSEGQMQRLSIARAILSDRPVLLLDECTSSLDERTEARLLQNLRELTAKTVVIVTHRPAALDIVDSIVRFSETGVRCGARLPKGNML